MSRYTFTEDEIKQVEEILINGNEFCSERKKILENFDENIEVQAVPGSGKTTLLVAKLFLLAQRIDFEKESVCILTHTNVAVDEIKKKLKKARHNNNIEQKFLNNVERILKFPNYIGTLQSFIDKYLATPGYLKKYGKRPARIEDSYVELLLQKLFYEKLSEDTKKGISYVFERGRNTFKGFSAGLARLNRTYLKPIGTNFELVFTKAQIYQEIKINIPPTTQKQKDRYTDILKIKIEQVIDNGYLTFQEANYFAEDYFNMNNLVIRKFINNRFQFVFIDEIQDTNLIHINLLNQLFLKSKCLIQGFGDKNQSILEGDNEEGYKFELFSKEKQIKSSRRLSKEIANGVWKCSINPLELEGIEDRNIPIYFYVYDDSCKDELLKFYEEKILEHDEKFSSIDIEDRIFKVIGRTHDGIKLYIPNYEGKEKNRKNYFLDYFQKVDNVEFKKEGFKIYKDNILESIIRFCNISGIKNGDKGFSKTTFLKYLRDNNEDYLNELLAKIYIWTKKINDLTLLSEETDEEIKELLGKIEIDGKKLDFDNNFFNTSKSYPMITFSAEEGLEEVEHSSSNDLVFEYGSIHGVKGETHTGTLILDIKSGTESNNRIFQFINDDSNKESEGKNKKDSIKLFYVGMTRATHLLVIGINKSLYKDGGSSFLSNVDSDYIFPK